MSKITIIGAGPGGYETAVAAAKRGFEVTIISDGPVGGTCLNEGCIPTKSFCRNAEILEDLAKGSVFGVENLSYDFDFKKVVSRKNEVVEQLKSGVEFLLNGKGITLLRGKASFKDNRTVIVSTDQGEQEVESDYIIIATGSHSASLPVPGADLEGVITSREILDIEKVPSKLCVIGGGVIGLEFASIFKSFGSEVTVVEYCKDILPRFDVDLAKRLKQSLTKRGINIETSAQVTGIYVHEAGLEVKYLKKEKECSLGADKVLMAVGRRPNVNTINLDDVGIEYSAKGVIVDREMRTTIPNIFAIGDVVGGMMLAHVAIFQGLTVLDAIQAQEFHHCGCGGHHHEEGHECHCHEEGHECHCHEEGHECHCHEEGHECHCHEEGHECHCHEEEQHEERGCCCGGGRKQFRGLPINLAIVPAAVFTYPEAAMVGLTEEDCQKYGIPVKCYKSFYRANGKALSMGEPEGFCKLIVEEGTDLILGCHMFGAHSSDVIQEITVLINHWTTLKGLQGMIHSHPTLTEVIQAAAHSA